MDEDRASIKPSKRTISMMVLAAPRNLLGDRYGSAHCMGTSFAAEGRGLTCRVHF